MVGVGRGGGVCGLCWVGEVRVVRCGSCCVSVVRFDKGCGTVVGTRRRSPITRPYKAHTQKSTTRLSY